MHKKNIQCKSSTQRNRENPLEMGKYSVQILYSNFATMYIYICTMDMHFSNVLKVKYVFLKGFSEILQRLEIMGALHFV